MFSDKKIIFVFEYIIGFTLLIVALPFIVSPQPVWSNAHWWAYLLFLINSAFMFIGCGSEMKRRIEMSARIEKLEKMLGEQNGAQNQPESQPSQKRAPSEQLVGSAN
ncbi:MAG: hypothetical protein JW749_03685 [Sedimentisphaerales bacterium]|nr:hypothetical protein [Sedimentisphaerales bacterium]